MAAAAKSGVLVPQAWHLESEEISDPVEQYEAMTRVAQEAERLGFDSVWVYDHFITVPVPSLKSVFECWTSTAALARDTKTIRLGQLVTCPAYRNPTLLAKMASTVDVLSHGRLNLGLGAGYYEPEYTAYGYDFPDARTRLETLEETLQVVRAMWTEPYASFEGKHYRVQGAINEPKGVQKPHPPIWIGGEGEKVTLKIVAKYADAYNITSFNPQVVQRKYDILQDHCNTLGRDYGSILKSAYFVVFLVTPGEKDRVEEVTAPFRYGYPLDAVRQYGLMFIGTPGELLETCHTLLGVGVEYFIFNLVQVSTLERLNLLASEVLPSLR